MKEKVIVGLSGGVDSAIAAYQLKKQGYEVVCAFMRNWDSTTNNDFLGNPTLGENICPQEKDYNDALSVAKALDLPLLRVDFIKEYWDHVFTYFLEEYKKGHTPNPDILCNKHIKFKCFLDFALSQGAKWVATGHYARVDHSNDESIMLKGSDCNKDQTYFLCQLSQYQLSKTLFPIGNMTKQEVRKIAKELNLSIADKKDSTGICFIGERNFKEFLKNYLPAKPGNIVDIETNKIVGKHEGVMYHTIGQRRGLGIGGEGGPWFVVGKDLDKQILYVAQNDENKWLQSTSCLVTDFNWINKIEENEFDCMAKFRYRQKDNEVRVKILNENEVLVSYPQKIKAVTPGQACVLYLGDRCLGGGNIAKVYQNDKLIKYL